MKMCALSLNLANVKSCQLFLTNNNEESDENKDNVQQPKSALLSTRQKHTLGQETGSAFQAEASSALLHSFATTMRTWLLGPEFAC